MQFWRFSIHSQRASSRTSALLSEGWAVKSKVSRLLVCGKRAKMVSDLVPNASGRKEVLADIERGAVEPVIETLCEGVAALYNNHRIDDALTVETIRPSWRPRNGPILPRPRPPSRALANIVIGALAGDFAEPFRQSASSLRGSGSDRRP